MTTTRQRLLAFSNNFGAFSSNLTNLSGWYAPTASVVNGVLTITPTLATTGGPLNDGNLIANGDMETGDPPTGWSASNATLDGVADGGSQVLGVTATVGYGNGSKNTVAPTAATWYKTAGRARLVSGGGAVYLNVSGAGISSTNSPSTSSATFVTLTQCTRSVNTDVFNFKAVVSASGAEGRFDDVSIRAISLPTACLLRRCRLADYNLTSPLISALTTGTQAGIFLNCDSPTNPQNFILIYCNGAGSVVIDKCVAGTYTNIATITQAWANSKKFDVQKLGNSYAVFYGTADFATPLFRFDLSGMTGSYFGLFSTFASNSFSAVANPFSMKAVSGAVSFAPSITPTLATTGGPLNDGNLVTNGTFAAWTGDNPDGWLVTGESGVDPMVTQAGPTGQCRIYESTGAFVGIGQSILSVGSWYQETIDVNAVAAGGVREGDALSGIYAFYTATGSKLATGRAASAIFQVWRYLSGAGNDVTFDNTSVRALSLPTACDLRETGRTEVALYTKVASLTTGTQAGAILRADSTSNPANFLVCYFDGAGNVKLDECVAGTYTSRMSVAKAFTSNDVLICVISGANFSIYHLTASGTLTLLGSGSSIALLTGTLHGGFSTYASNSVSTIVV